MQESMEYYLDELSEAYYEGNPLISDAEFDRLADLYGYEKVGYTAIDAVPHYFPMLSLQKCFSLQEAPLSLDGTVSTVKLDGAAVSLLYIDGVYVQALTRGDGKAGRNITDKLATLVPETILRTGIVQITGEIVAPKTIPNSRNYAAGALNLKSSSEFKKRNLTFIAYDIQPKFEAYWVEDLLCLKEDGFSIITEVPSGIFPDDGIVFRVDNNDTFDSLGKTAKHPKGAFALKDQQTGQVTKLLDVIWQVGKSGVVSPVAILDPVEIKDAIVSRATLHNIEYIRGLNLEIGCNVEVVRSGEIIPRILRRVD